MLCCQNPDLLLKLFLLQLLDFHFGFEQLPLLLHLKEDLPEPEPVLSFLKAGADLHILLLL